MEHQSQPSHSVAETEQETRDADFQSNQSVVQMEHQSQLIHSAVETELRIRDANFQTNQNQNVQQNLFASQVMKIWLCLSLCLIKNHLFIARRPVRPQPKKPESGSSSESHEHVIKIKRCANGAPISTFPFCCRNGARNKGCKLPNKPKPKRPTKPVRKPSNEDMIMFVCLFN
jgi:hypothetical protein